MTKTPTEQMKTEHGAWYYVKTKEWGICHWLLFPDTLDIEKDIVEVLAPVPSYDEFVQQRDFVKDHQKVLIENMNLKRKLEIATKALKYYDGLENIIVDWKLLTGQEAGTAKNALKKLRR